LLPRASLKTREQFFNSASSSARETAAKGAAQGKQNAPENPALKSDAL
jgi:hypothetical protein